MTTVIVQNAALEDFNGDIILRGTIHPDSLQALRVDSYQREALPLTSQGSILSALREMKPLPDIELSVRGSDYTEKKDGIHITLPTYVVDGQQRVTTAMHFIQVTPDAKVSIGAKIYFGKSRDWEVERFRTLNSVRTKVSPNVILANMRETNHAVASLYGLTHNDVKFALRNRVSWTQRMKNGELITANTFLSVVNRLHAHKVSAFRSNIDFTAAQLEKLVEVVGIRAVRENTSTFFEIVDECFGIRRSQYREGARHMRGSFLYVLAKYFSDHVDFWQQDAQERKLFMAADLRRKLSLFPVHDPSVANLMGSGGQAANILYGLLRDHMNSGKRTRKLKSRHGETINLSGDEDEEAEAA